MVNFKITKIQKLWEQVNDMAHNYYFVIYGRIYNEGKTRMRKFKYVEWFDIFDVMEFFDKDFVTKEDVREYVGNIENGFLYGIKDYYDEKGLKEFYNYCNETIKDYNRIIANNNGRIF